MTSATKHQTEIIADPALPTLAMVREFDAPPERVFRAWIEPDLIVQWLGPNDTKIELDRWDATTGGGYRYRAVRGEEEFGFYGSFHEVRPSERLVQTFTFEGIPDGVSLDTMTFEALEGGRCRVSALSVVDSMEARDAMVASGMETGVLEGYAKLDDLLTKPV
jgi:uncharacterized protein YndB with AHSA1/START domain